MLAPSRFGNRQTMRSGLSPLTLGGWRPVLSPEANDSQGYIPNRWWIRRRLPQQR